MLALSILCSSAMICNAATSIKFSIGTKYATTKLTYGNGKVYLMAKSVCKQKHPQSNHVCSVTGTGHTYVGSGKNYVIGTAHPYASYNLTEGQGYGYANSKLVAHVNTMKP